MAKQKTLYGVLGVSTKASADEVRDAWRKAVRSAHPDSGGSPEKFHAVQEAYRILSDQQLRRIYDEELSAGRSNAQAQTTSNTNATSAPRSPGRSDSRTSGAGAASAASRATSRGQMRDDFLASRLDVQGFLGHVLRHAPIALGIVAGVFGAESLYNTGWISGNPAVRLAVPIATSPWPQWPYWVYFELFCAALILAPAVKWYWRLFAWRLRVATGVVGALFVLGTIGMRHHQPWAGALACLCALLLLGIRVVSWCYLWTVDWLAQREAARQQARRNRRGEAFSFRSAAPGTAARAASWVRDRLR